MKNGLIVSDTGPIFSLAIIDKLDILNKLFDEILIPNAVWEELTKNKSAKYYNRIVDFFKNKVQTISSYNELAFIMDYGESEAVKLYIETNADFLLIDDRKARIIAENIGINCIGTIGILAVAKDQMIVEKLKPLFELFLINNRFYSVNLLNSILKKYGENEI